MRWLAAGVLAVMILTLSAGTARALCGGVSSPGRSLAAGNVAFVGTVGSLRNNDRWATFQVDEVWSSDELPRFVEVRGSTPDESFLSFLGIFTSVSSNDRFFEEGVTYLVLPEPEGGILFDNDCTATQEWSSELAALRPATAHPPSPSLAESGPGTLWPVAVAALALLAGVGVMFRRRRPRGSGGEPTPV